MNRYLCLDPGSEKTGWVIIDDAFGLHGFGKDSNEALLHDIRAGHVRGQGFDFLACEFPQPRGQPVGRELFETVYWIGRFAEIFDGDMTRIDRAKVKKSLCPGLGGRARDSNVRAALIELWGGQEQAIGRKPKNKKDPARPGPLHGMSADAWAALAVAVTHLRALGHVRR